LVFLSVVQGLVPNDILKCYVMTSPIYARGGYYTYGQYSNPSQTPALQPPPSPRPSPYSLRERLYSEVPGVSNTAQVYEEIPADSISDLLEDEDDMLDDTEYGAVGGIKDSDKTYRYRAEYSHTSRSRMELSITKGDFINVILQHDKDGNTDWWLVANNKGEQGYVPYNYLRKIE